MCTKQSPASFFVDVEHHAFGGDGSKVAVVDTQIMAIQCDEAITDALDVAYMLTNTINAPWWTNDYIEPTEKARQGCRSTSIGDVMVLRDTEGNELGRYIVDAFGFTREGNGAKHHDQPD